MIRIGSEIYVILLDHSTEEISKELSEEEKPAQFIRRAVDSEGACFKVVIDEEDALEAVDFVEDIVEAFATSKHIIEEDLAWFVMPWGQICFFFTENQYYPYTVCRLFDSTDDLRDYLGF